MACHGLVFFVSICGCEAYFVYARWSVYPPNGGAALSAEVIFTAQ